jgi:hypothetical protein
VRYLSLWELVYVSSLSGILLMQTGLQLSQTQRNVVFGDLRLAVC